MESREFSYRSALNDFNEARLRATFEEMLARLTGRSSELLSYEEVAEKLGLNVRSERGIQHIPLKAIVGSVGRYTDFTRSFMPRKGGDQQRWARVKAAVDNDSGPGMPPIDVYKVGEAYFVLDGNHRVSVARREGFESIEAHVIEVQTDVPITPDLKPDDLIIKSEYAGFLRETGLAGLRPGVDLSVSVPGQYARLLEHIQVHRYFMGLDLERDISGEEAVAHWYDAVYLPAVEPIRERGLLRWFPGRTETDLYLWVSEYRAALEGELGWSIRPDAAVAELAAKENPRAEAEQSDTGRWRAMKMVDRYTDRLFRDVLVSVNGTAESWRALEQAIELARREGSALHGLHVVAPRARVDSARQLAVQARFSDRCREAGIPGSLAVVKGDVTDQVCERALLTDVIVLNVSHPPARGLSSLGSGIRSIIARSARPILAVTGEPSPMDHVVLAFDGGPKAREALFVATYIAEKWRSSLTVLTLADHSRVSPSVQDHARSYLELHEIQAEYVVCQETLENLPKVLVDRGANLVLMGGYGGGALKGLVVDSAVNLLLRDWPGPILICR
jgi:nucleotide-binding universal stress UspA family protein